MQEYFNHHQEALMTYCQTLVDHRIDHKCPKLLNIPLLNTKYDAAHVPSKTILGRLQPREIENIEISNV